MTWVRLDDLFTDHPKLAGISDAAFRLHVAALCYCGRWGTDGKVPKAALSGLYPKQPARRAVELVDAGLWHTSSHLCDVCPPIDARAYVVHAFLEYNPSGGEVDEAAQKRVEKARRAARARWEKDAHEHAHSNTQALPGGMLADAPSPVPGLVTSLPGTWEPPDPQPVDDDEEFAATTTPIDPVEITVRAVFDRCAKQRMTGIKANNPTAYTASVLNNLELEHGDGLRRAIETHPNAPVDVLAGWVLGEANSLASYRVVAS